MKIKRIHSVLFTAVLALSACSSSDDEITYEDFVDEVVLFAETGANDCGYAYLEQSSTHMVECAVGAFNENQSFYIFQENSSADSIKITAVAMNPSGKVMSWTYTGSSTSGEIVSTECENPAITDELLTPTTYIFECSNS